MGKGKSVSKSIRMTDEVFCYIDGYQGEGFNQKLENIVLDSMVAEKERKKRLEFLDKQIASQNQQLRKLLLECDVVTRIRRQAITVERDMDAFRREVEKLTEPPKESEV